MRIRYKRSLEERETNRFNTQAMSEVLTGDDSAFISDLDVFVNDGWKDMRQAFKYRDIIPDNYNQTFDVPRNEFAKARGWND